MTSSKNRDIWNTLKSFDSWWCAVFIEGFSSRRLTVDVNFIATSCCKAEEYAECFVSCDQGALVNGCDFYFCGINPIDRLKLFWKLVCLLFLGKTTLPNIGAFLKCHKMSQKNDDNFPHITCSSVRNHMIWHFWRSEYSVPEIKHWRLDLVLKRSASCRRNYPLLSKNAMISSLVISVSPIEEKQNIFFPDDKILCDADCVDMSRSGDILNSLGPIRISFARWVYLSKD